MGTEDIFVHITLLFLGNPLETFSADELLSQKAQFYDSWPILPHYFQILLFMVPPSTWGYTSFTTASSKPCITTLRNYNSVDANDFVKFVFFILNEDKFSFSYACLHLFGKAGFGSSRVRCFPWGSLQVEPAFTKTSELPDRARVWNAVGTLAPGSEAGPGWDTGGPCSHRHVSLRCPCSFVTSDSRTVGLPRLVFWTRQAFSSESFEM